MKKGIFCNQCNQIPMIHICLNENFIEEPIILYKCNCEEKRKNLNLFLQENIINYDNKRIKCEIHNKKYNGYCLSCKRNVCDECKIHYHNNFIEHKTQIFKNIFDENLFLEINNNFKNAKNKLVSNYFLLKCKSEECVNSEKYLNEINNLYEKNLEINKKILELLSLIYKMFDIENNCYEIITNIYNNSFFNLNIIDSKNIIDYINYFKSEYIIYPIKENDIFLLSKPIFFEKIDSVENIIILSNEKIGISSNKKIIIYNQNSFLKEQEIEAHEEKINYLFESSDKKLFSCSSDFSINIYKYDINNNQYILDKTLVEHKNEVLKILEINNNFFISCSKDNYLFFREGKNLDFIFKKIYIDNFRFNSIDNFNDNIYITSRNGLKILSLKTYEIKDMIIQKNDINIFSPIYYLTFFGKKPLEKINNDLILYKTQYELFIINNKNIQIQSIISIGNEMYLQHAFFLKIFNGNIYLCRVDGYLQIYGKNDYKQKFGLKGVFTYFKKGISLIEKSNNDFLISYDLIKKQLIFWK